jgi:type VI secretion system secreted protein Hcp
MPLLVVSVNSGLAQWFGPVSGVRRENVMAADAYMSLTGHKSGQVQGSVTLHGHEGSMRVVAVAHEISTPRDPQSGLPTGKRMHRPMVVTKELDKSSPILYRMLATNETITSLVIQFMVAADRDGGALVNNYTIKLTNASIADISFVMPSTVDAATAKSPEVEKVSFTYQKIEWTWK